jgi:hypothetical protein
MAHPDDVDCRWQEVKCAGCGKEYTCTPQQDYFTPAGFTEPKTLTNGYCWDCFMEVTGMKPQPEPPYTL